MDDKLAPAKRRKQKLPSGVVVAWDQTFNEVNLYVPTSAAVPTKRVQVRIASDAATVVVASGVGKEVLLDALKFYARVVSDESVWTRDTETGEVHCQFAKVKRGEPWKSCFLTTEDKGEDEDEGEEEEDRMRMMRERLTRENPGFDFTEATFEGSVGGVTPDASEWNLGGRNR